MANKRLKSPSIVQVVELGHLKEFENEIEGSNPEYLHSILRNMSTSIFL